MLSLVFSALAKLSTNVWTHILVAIHAVPYSVPFYAEAHTEVFVALKQRRISKVERRRP